VDLGEAGQSLVDLLALAALDLVGFVLDVREQGARLAVEQKPAVVDEAHAMAALGLVHVGSRQENGHAVVDQFVQQGPQLAAADRVHAIGGLVEQQHLGTVEQGAGQGQLLVHPA